MCTGSQPPPPPPPPPPIPEPPSPSDPDIQRSPTRVANAARSRFGSSATFATGGQGLTDDANVGRSLIGGALRPRTRRTSLLGGS